jgi:hypothetical protein
MEVKRTVFIEELDKDVEVVVEIDHDDVMDYVRYEAYGWDLEEIADACDIDCDPGYHDVETFISNASMTTKQSLIDVMLGRDSGVTLNSTLEDEMKEEWWAEIRKKYTLSQLEEVLGNKFQM